MRMRPQAERNRASVAKGLCLFYTHSVISLGNFPKAGCKEKARMSGFIPSALHRHHRVNRRLAEIARVLAHHGWGYLIKHLDLQRFLPWGQRSALRATEEPPLPEVVTALLTDLGPSFVKAGQLLSTRPDLLPRAYVEALERLQESGPQVPIEEVRQTIEEELGEPPETLFAHFEETPLASASLAQVHRARLHDGTEVVVKVQRPGIRDVVETDVEIAVRFAKLLEERLPAMKEQRLVAKTVALGEMLRGELDFTREFRNAERFRLNFAEVGYVFIPKCHWNLTTPRVLTEDYVDGMRASAIEEIEAAGYSRRHLARRIAECTLKQIYIDGFFHGDLHPGNVRILAPDKIGLIDFGIAGELSRADQRELITALLCFLNNDPDGFTTHILRLAEEAEGLDSHALRRDFAALMQEAHATPAAKRTVGEVLRETMGVIFQHHLALPEWFGLLVKTYIASEGICRRLDPGFDYAEVARRMASQAISPHLQLQELLPGLWSALQEIKELLKYFPSRLNRLLDIISRGELTADVKHKGLDDLTAAIQRGSSRITSGTIVAGLVLASAILVQADVGPWYEGYSVIGLIGFFFAAILGGWVLIDIVRRGR